MTEILVINDAIHENIYRNERNLKLAKILVNTARHIMQGLSDFDYFISHTTVNALNVLSNRDDDERNSMFLDVCEKYPIETNTLESTLAALANHAEYYEPKLMGPDVSTIKSQFSEDTEINFHVTGYFYNAEKISRSLRDIVNVSNKLTIDYENIVFDDWGYGAGISSTEYEDNLEKGIIEFLDSNDKIDIINW